MAFEKRFVILLETTWHNISGWCVKGNVTMNAFETVIIMYGGFTLISVFLSRVADYEDV